MAPYPLRTTLLAFADDMAVVTATAHQPLPTTPDPTRATKVLHVVNTYLEGNQLLVHNAKSATMVHNAPPLPLRPRGPPMNPVNMATYLEVQQAATAGGVTLPPNLTRQLTRILVIARTTALSTQALAYFLQAVLNAAIRFQALHLTHPEQMLQATATTVRRAWTIHGHRPTSLPATVRVVSPPYYGNNTDHLVNKAYTGHTAAHLHCLMHNHEPEVREVLTLTLQEAQYHGNTCLQYILHHRGLPTKVGTRVWNHLQLLVPHHQHVIQTRPSGRMYRICNQKEKARQTQNTKQQHKRRQHTTYHSGPQMSRKEEQMQYKCRVHMQRKCTLLNTTWTLIHTKGLVNICMATCSKQSHICSQWFMHSLVCMPCESTSIAQLIKYYAAIVIPSELRGGKVMHTEH